MNKVPTFITWIKGAYGDSAFDGGGEDFDISSEEKQNVTSDQMGGGGGGGGGKKKHQKKEVYEEKVYWKREGDRKCIATATKAT